MNISQVVWYKEQVGEQKVEEVKPVKMNEVKEWEVEEILNKKNKRSGEIFSTIEGIYN